LVFAFTTEAIDVEAEVMVPAVEATPFVTAVPREVEAVRIEEFVFALTAEVIPDVWVLVLAFTTAAIDEEAVVTSDWRARVPESSVPSESLRVANDQMSAADAPPPPPDP
jgi:hypothetical protein